MQESLQVVQQVANRKKPAAQLCSSIVRNREQKPFSFTLFPAGAGRNTLLCQNNLNSGFLMRSVLCLAFVQSFIEGSVMDGSVRHLPLPSSPLLN